MRKTKSVYRVFCVTFFPSCISQHFLPWLAFTQKVKGFHGIFFHGINKTQNSHEMWILYSECYVFRGVFHKNTRKMRKCTACVTRTYRKLFIWTSESRSTSITCNVRSTIHHEPNFASFFGEHNEYSRWCLDHSFDCSVWTGKNFLVKFVLIRAQQLRALIQDISKEVMVARNNDRTIKTSGEKKRIYTNNPSPQKVHLLALIFTPPSVLPNTKNGKFGHFREIFPNQPFPPPLYSKI